MLQTALEGKKTNSFAKKQETVIYSLDAGGKKKPLFSSSYSGLHFMEFEPRIIFVCTLQTQKELHRNALFPDHSDIQQLQDTLSCGCPWKAATKEEGNWEHIYTHAS